MGLHIFFYYLILHMNIGMTFDGLVSVYCAIDPGVSFGEPHEASDSPDMPITRESIRVIATLRLRRRRSSLVHSVRRRLQEIRRLDSET